MSVQQRRQVLGSLLIERGLLSAPDLERALAEQKRTGEFLGTILIRMGLISGEQLLPMLAEQVGMPYMRLATARILPEVIAKVPPKFASHYCLMPLALVDGVLEVAIADPFDVQTIDELKLLLDCDVRPVLASQAEIQEAIQRHYGVGASAVERLLDTSPQQAAAKTSAAEDLTAQSNEASVIAFVNQLILSAVRDRATDIHVEPFDQTLRIRQRIDGVMYEMPLPTDLFRLHPAIVSRIKVMAQLDIAERRLPQDGRIKVRLEGQELDLRISVLPSSFGESVEIRLLSSNMLFSLEQLGLSGDHLTLLLQLIQKPHGIIFVTGPTGSGKTTTLYACLSKLNAPNVKILTIEDPIEYQLQGITQLQVHPKIGFSFAQGLRSMLRHDPDIMMVGEVRDPETAEITIRSALTGHLVFSTLHTNDAAGGVTRLLDMGIEPFLVASSVLGFIAQRLVRVVCAGCAEARPPQPGLAEEFGPDVVVPQTLRYGRGCPACKGTGYKGRTAIYEFLLLTDAIQALILRRASSHEIAQAAQRAGQMRTLRQDGWQKIVQGVTTPEEVLRVT
jgi:type II secretion system protein E